MITNTDSVIEEWIAMSKLTLFGRRTWPEAIYSTWEEMSFARYSNNRDFTMTDKFIYGNGTGGSVLALSYAEILRTRYT